MISETQTNFREFIQMQDSSDFKGKVMKRAFELNSNPNGVYRETNLLGLEGVMEKYGHCIFRRPEDLHLTKIQDLESPNDGRLFFNWADVFLSNPTLYIGKPKGTDFQQSYREIEKDIETGLVLPGFISPHADSDSEFGPTCRFFGGVSKKSYDTDHIMLYLHNEVCAAEQKGRMRKQGIPFPENIELRLEFGNHNGAWKPIREMMTYLSGKGCSFVLGDLNIGKIDCYHFGDNK